MYYKIKLSIIIVNYKVKESLLNCIKSIYASKPKTKFEIIVVDNDEKNTLYTELLKLFPGINYIKSPFNLGYGGGNNLGAQRAKGEYLFFLNPDTIIYDNSIDELTDYLENNKKAGIVAPLLLDKSKQPYKLQGTKELTPFRAILAFSFIGKIFPKILNQFWLMNWNKKDVIKSGSVAGTALMIRKDVFIKVGKFDKKFFLFFEEFDLCKRVKELGYGIYINPKAKIFHQWGESTKNIKQINEIFAKSRFYYFRKHFGLIKALLLEGFLLINKTSVTVLFLLFLAFILRIYNLSNGMAFIGDQGWFYLSARDLLIHGNIPLVGITSSHTWLHQGPLWTYILSVALFIFKFNPLAGGYVTVLFGTATVFLMYKLGSLLFSKNVGIIAAAFYASSPLIILFDRMPFDPSPIPFFSLLFLFLLVKWIKGNVNYFPFAILLIAILYNLELATFTLFFPFSVFFIYGFIKKMSWVRKLLNKKTIIYSIIAGAIPMLPIIIYDFSNGFKQTIVFLGWTIYKPFSFLFTHSSGNFFANLKIVVGFGFLNLQKLIFQENLIAAVIIFFAGFIYLTYLVFKSKKIETSEFVLCFLLLISLLGIIVNQTPSDAYLPIIFPFLIFTNAIVFAKLFKISYFKYLFLLIIFMIVSLNSYSAFKNDSANEFKDRLTAVNKIIIMTGNQKYNLLGKGPGSQFKSFTMNYEYLLWWKGYPPSENNAKLKIVISETKNGIEVTNK
jgi:GT2 family glycosyltransferase